MNKESKITLNYRQTLLIGLGFFASSLLWSLYNSFVPLILADFITSTAAIGLIMTIDNIFGVIFQPYFGARSDRTRSRFGRRMPYILVGAPLCAILFTLIPRMPELWLLMSVIIAFNLIMSVWRAPMIALMPDLTPDSLRSRANGVINLMGGLASIIAFLIGGRIAHSYGRGATFLMGAVVMLIAVVVLFFSIKENRLNPSLFDPIKDHDDQRSDQKKGATDEELPPGGGLSGFKKLPPASRRSLFFLLLAIFFWFCGFNAVETFFTSYATNQLGQTEGQAAMLLAFFSVSFVIFAVPSGFIADRVGRRRTIVLGLLGLFFVFIPLLFISDLWVIRILLLIGGMFWAAININSLPMVLELAGINEMGTFTGYYYFFSFSASIASPILFGLVRDLSGTFQSLFIYAPITFFMALLAILQVTHSEEKPALD